MKRMVGRLSSYVNLSAAFLMVICITSIRLKWACIIGVILAVSFLPVLLSIDCGSRFERAVRNAAAALSALTAALFLTIVIDIYAWSGILPDGTLHIFLFLALALMMLCSSLACLLMKDGYNRPKRFAAIAGYCFYSLEAILIALVFWGERWNYSLFLFAVGGIWCLFQMAFAIQFIGYFRKV